MYIFLIYPSITLILFSILRTKICLSTVGAVGATVQLLESSYRLSHYLLETPEVAIQRRPSNTLKDNLPEEVILLF